MPLFVAEQHVLAGFEGQGGISRLAWMHIAELFEALQLVFIDARAAFIHRKIRRGKVCRDEQKFGIFVGGVSLVLTKAGWSL